MPKNYEQLISHELTTEYCLQRAKVQHALDNPNSAESNLLYRMVAEEMARREPPLLIPYVEICISPQCTLNCRDCANFMQYYYKPQPMNLEQVWSWIDAFLEAIDAALTVRVMGGEPLMQKQLPELMRRLLAHSKVQHTQIVTNGTLEPKDDLLKLMQANKQYCSFFFSRYGSKLAPRFDEFTQKCLRHGLMVQAPEDNKQWFDMGDTASRHRSVKELTEVYQKCPNNCRHIWNGEFHHCPRSAHGKYLGLIDMPETDYVPLMTLDTATRRERIRAMYDLPYITACNHCGLMPETHYVPPAIQADRAQSRVLGEKLAQMREEKQQLQLRLQELQSCTCKSSFTTVEGKR